MHCQISVSLSLCLSFSSFPNWPLYMQSKERLKKETGHSRLVGSKFKNKGTYIQGLTWAVEGKQISTPACQILKVYIECFYHIYCLNTTPLCQGCVLGVLSGSKEGKHNLHSKDRGGVRSAYWLGPAHRSNSAHVLLVNTLI